MTVADGKVTVNVPAADGGTRSAEVWLCPITGKAQVAIGRGENRGHTLTYTNVVRRWVKLGDWSGKAETFSVPVADLPDARFFAAGHRPRRRDRAERRRRQARPDARRRDGRSLSCLTAFRGPVGASQIALQRTKKSGRRLAGPKA